jgi:hypothetical protein
MPQLHTLMRILCEEVHTMLLRNKKYQAALRHAQAKYERAMATS